MKKTVDDIRAYLLGLQENICASLSAVDGAPFVKDYWEREKGGDGLTRVLEDSTLIERGGVNFSHVMGDALPKAATARMPELAGVPFESLGISLVIHPRNPYVPTVHGNLRFFIAHGKEAPVWWFGGGFDLTPYYPVLEDCVAWHQAFKSACDPFGEEVYPRFKKHCDDYFYLPHRKETRGVGGLFFDDLNEGGVQRNFDFIQSVGESFLPAYLPIVEKHKDTVFTEQETEFQRYRRGRYVEFNLLYDRGTQFGVQFGGRTESILVSMPKNAIWRYDWAPTPGSKEAELEAYLRPRDWLGV